ncbi:MAG: DUF5060 domain-containing protein [Bacteroidota bacterium]
MKPRILSSVLALWAGITVLSAQPAINRVFLFPEKVVAYEKIELSVSLDAVFDNPFDPDDVSLEAVFISPSGKEWRVPGFYSQRYRGGFSVRFSADEPGQWTYMVKVRDRNGTAGTEARKFLVGSPEKHGPIRIAENKRYLEHADGVPWYGVGMWYNGPTEPEVLDELQEKGVNYISHLITPLETWGTGLGRYDQLLCSQIDEMLEELEKRDMQLSLNIWFHSFLSETVWGGGNIAWYTNPYALVTKAKDFYSSEEAWKYQEKLYRYMIARWGYSRSLALWFVIDEVNGTDGWASGDSLGATRWAQKVHDYFKQNDPWQHLTTGTRSGGVFEWWDKAYEFFDMPGREMYEAQGFPVNGTGKIDKAVVHPLASSYRNYHAILDRLWKNYEKPVIIPETGWDHTFYEMSMPGYLAQYHNAIWVAMASGSPMTPFWWAYSDALNDNVVTNQMKSLARFTEKIPFSTLSGLKTLNSQGKECDVYALVSDQMIIGWAVNAETDLSGKKVLLPGITEGSYKLRLYHTWRGRFLDEEESGIQEDFVVKAGKNGISFDLPVLKIKDGHAAYVGQDMAFILEPAGN